MLKVMAWIVEWKGDLQADKQGICNEVRKNWSQAWINTLFGIRNPYLLEKLHYQRLKRGKLHIFFVVVIQQPLETFHTFCPLQYIWLKRSKKKFMVMVALACAFIRTNLGTISMRPRPNYYKIYNYWYTDDSMQ